MVGTTAATLFGIVTGAGNDNVNVAPTVETLTGQDSVPGVVLPNAMRAVLVGDHLLRHLVAAIQI